MGVQINKLITPITMLNNFRFSFILVYPFSFILHDCKMDFIDKY